MTNRSKTVRWAGWFLALVLSLAFALSMALTSVRADDAASGATQANDASAATGAGRTVILYTGNLRGDISKLAQIAAVKKNYESQADTTVTLVDVGNYLSGTKYTSYDMGGRFIGLMKTAGYDILGIGAADVQYGNGTTGNVNHGDEFVYGSLGTYAADSGMTLVSANIGGQGAAVCVDGYVANTMAAGGAIRVALFGVSSESVVTNSVLSNVTVADAAQTAAAQVSALAGADVIVGLSNAGVTAVEGAQMLDVSGDEFAMGALVIDNATRTVARESITLDGVSEDAETAAQAEAYKAVVDASYPDSAVVRSEVVLNGRQSDVRSRETNLGDFWTDALRWFATSGRINQYFSEDAAAAGNASVKTDADHVVALWNGGNLRNYVQKGSVIDTDIYRVLPYPNKVAVVYLSGTQLLEQLEASTQNITSETAADSAFLSVSGIRFALDAYKSYDRGESYNGSPNWYKAKSIRRVSIESINGKPFDRKATYAVITHNGNFNGMDACYVMNEKGPDSTITSMAVRDAVLLYIREGLNGVIGQQYATADNRIQINYAKPPQEGPDTDTSLPVKPDKVKFVSITSPSKGKLTLKWKKVSGAVGYKIYQVKGGKRILIMTIKDAGTVKHTIKNLKSGTTYKYQIRAYNKAGGQTVYGAYSAVKSKKCK